MSFYYRNITTHHSCLFMPLTQSIVPLVIVVLAPATTEVLEDHSYVTEDDEGWRKDWTLMEGHNELVTLELPNLVGDGLHLEECIAMMMDNHRERCHSNQKKITPVHILN